jgi:hypothetical protein
MIFSYLVFGVLTVAAIATLVFIPVDFFLVVTVVFTDVREDAVPIIVETHSEYPRQVSGLYQRGKGLL